MYTGEYTGFNFYDHLQIEILSNYLECKFAEIKKLNKCREKDQRYADLINIITQLLHQKTGNGFIVEAKDEFPRFLGYESVGLLYLDVNCK